MLNMHVVYTRSIFKATPNYKIRLSIVAFEGVFNRGVSPRAGNVLICSALREPPGLIYSSANQ